METPYSLIDIIGQEYFDKNATIDSLTENLKTMDINFANNKTKWSRKHSKNYRKIQSKITNLENNKQ